MKSARMTSINAIALFVALTIPVSLAAQERHTEHHKYRLVDLGTFGGPASYDSAGLIAINSEGLAIGGAETSVLQPPHSNSSLVSS
jgi:tRNA G26 N,N-dimethylase Trm1